MSKHTEGPWEFHANEYHDGNKTFWVGNGEYVVFDCSPYGPKEMVFPPNLADARLICAAPDMLEALEALMPWMDLVLQRTMWTYDAQWDQLNKNAKRAIAKAKGKQL